MCFLFSFRLDLSPRVNLSVFTVLNPQSLCMWPSSGNVHKCCLQCGETSFTFLLDIWPTNTNKPQLITGEHVVCVKQWFKLYVTSIVEISITLFNFRGILPHFCFLNIMSILSCFCKVFEDKNRKYLEFVYPKAVSEDIWYFISQWHFA